MKEKTFILFSLFASLAVSAQEVISSQGESYSNSTANIEFTLGEVIINTGTDGNYDITQGFHQTNWNFLGVEDHAINVEAIIFPNPTSDVLNIKTSSFDQASYRLFDSEGKLVMLNILSAEQTPIQVGQLAPGAYSLELVFKDGNKDSLSSSSRKIFKLLKQ